ncbi:MAG: DNA adenine methylase [Anaerolineae bacterium]|nr:DNA adenine methylase [Anaerolineae bacterium]
MSIHNNHAAAPFLKWAGGKGQLLAQYESFFPQEPVRHYFEPFVGSGAVFFHLQARGLFERAHLSEVNAELITCYLAVRDAVGDLIGALQDHARGHAEHGAAHYYAVRAWDRAPDWASAPLVRRAARLIYLNKTCYNGLWRVNRQGHFNVPMGRYKNPEIVNEARLRAASRALQGVHLAVEDFEQVIRRAGRGDFVYLDPPYIPLSETANFTSYTHEEFGEYEQRKLALVFAELDRKGCRVMLSNSDTPLTRELYRAFRIETVSARRAINSASARRGAISEVVVLNY